MDEVVSAARGWTDRWMVSITCRDCGEAWECKGVSPSVERVGGFSRVFVAGGPEVCPNCKNLKAVEANDGDAED